MPRKSRGVVIGLVALTVAGVVIAAAIRASRKADKEPLASAKACADLKEAQIAVEQALEYGEHLTTRQRVEARDHLAQVIALRRACPTSEPSGSTEGDIERRMSFECAQQLRSVRAKGYGFSDKCRAEWEQAQKQE